MQIKVNTKVGKWLVVSSAGSDRARRKLWNCKCECGRQQIVQGYQLKVGRSSSCLMCSHAGINKTHGMTKTKFYQTFARMNARTNNPRLWNYDKYGGKGVKVLWNNFDEFKKDMYTSYVAHVKKYGEGNTSIDRIDVNGNYCKENCRWATVAVQSRNRTSNVVLEYDGKKMPVCDWATIVGIPAKRIRARLSKLGWSVERALTVKHAYEKCSI